MGAGYIFFWSGRPKAEQRDAGAAFTIRKDIDGFLPCLPQVAPSDYLPPAISNTTATASTSDGDSVLTCPHCDHTFPSHIGLEGHSQTHRTDTGELETRAPTYSRDHRLQCPHCLRAFTPPMGLKGHMRIHESGIHSDASTSCAPINTSRTLPMSLTTSTSSRAPAVSTLPELSCPHFHRTSRIGLVGQLRIHRKETGEPVVKEVIETWQSDANSINRSIDLPVSYEAVKHH
ncbi:unnamed protein product [Schistocephalus solidus]|uniref:C2H2-type domain-containing protein n=1 Tax=Schistocephalus solidus TaxID=70667 RepID=A0A183T7S2_SCHSO|nr:unnamed protein product [Schistocephalus solidus]